MENLEALPSHLLFQGNGGALLHLFDCATALQLLRAAKAGNDYDSAHLSDNTWERSASPGRNAGGQTMISAAATLESLLEPCFKPLAYALILAASGMATLAFFYADLYTAPLQRPRAATAAANYEILAR